MISVQLIVWFALRGEKISRTFTDEVIYSQIFNLEVKHKWIFKGGYYDDSLEKDKGDSEIQHCQK